MPVEVNRNRRDLDPEKLARLLRALQDIYPEHDVTRCNATVMLGEVRFNITITRKR